MKLTIMRTTVLCCLFLTSCGTQFNRKWAKAKTSVFSDQTSRIEGPWVGTWLSKGTGHTGKLRCVVGPALNSEGDHLFTYRATWKGFLSATFKATHRVKPDGKGHQFSGEHSLPNWAGGNYHYDGTTQMGRFEATYRCEKDHGSFSMKRP
jgi:hypothetical protein